MKRSFYRSVLSIVVLVAMLNPIRPTAAHAAVSCALGSVLNVVAHEDDDLLFLSPDLRTDIRNGLCVRTVFVTAGDAGNSDDSYWQRREIGVQAAYAVMAGVDDEWVAGSLPIGGRAVPLLTLIAEPAVSVAFLRLPDGSPTGEGFSVRDDESLQQLWVGDETQISSLEVAGQTFTYTRQALIDTLRDLIDASDATEVNTQDYTASFRGANRDRSDHSDHLATARFAQAGLEEYAGTPVPAFHGYRDYPTSYLPANLSSTQADAKQDAFLAYGAHDSAACPDPDCSGISADYSCWLARQYQVPGPNLARFATASASSQDTSTEQTAAKAIDGVAGGFGFDLPNDYRREWATVLGGVGSTLTLTWPTSRTVGRIVLYDRPNGDDQITGAQLHIGTATTVTVGALDNDGQPVEVTLATPQTVSSIQLQVTAVSGSTGNVGLSEIEVYGDTTASSADPVCP